MTTSHAGEILPLFQTAIAKHPSDGSLRVRYAEALLRQFRLVEATAVLESAVAIDGAHLERANHLLYWTRRIRGKETHR